MRINKHISNINKALALISIFSLHFIHTKQATNHYITQKNGWSIHSPSLYATTATTKKAPHKLAYLNQLGKQADHLWHTTAQKEALILPFSELFAPINHQFLLDVIDQIVHDEKLLEQVTAASYRNVIGFLKIVLANGGPEGWKIRLHVWEQKEEKEFPHNHKWDFYSKIISGYLSQDLYQITNNLEEGTLHSVREPVSLMPKLADGSLPCPCRDNYELKTKECSLDTVFLRKLSTDIIGIGESYFMPNHLIHTINPGRGAISCAFTSAKITENSEVFVPENRVTTDLSRNAPSVTKQELREELLRIKAMLQQLHLQPAYLPELVDNNHHYFHPDTTQRFDKNWRNELAQHISKKSVVQLCEKKKQQYLLTTDTHNNVVINNTFIDPNQEYIFVFNDNQMYAAPKDFHHTEQALICHSSFTDYGPVESVGILHFNHEKKVNLIEAYSGHYGPSVADMQPALVFLQSLGVTTQDVECVPFFDRKA